MKENIKYKLLLINVVDTTKLLDSPKHIYPINKLTSFQPLALGIIAALTPPYWEVEIIDENFDEFDFKKNYDASFVGLSSYSTSINRTILIANHFVTNNTPIIIGGTHASLFPNDLVKTGISVFKGEVEDIWETVILDFENKRLKSYYAGSFCDIEKTPKPNRQIFEKYNYEIAAIEFSRGCPFNCSFCGVPVSFGNKLRYRSVDSVIEELKTIKQKYVIFKDDNIIGSSTKHKEKAIELFRKIISNKIKKNFLCFVSINIANDDFVLKLARKAGFVLFFIGIESEKIKGITSINKTVNVESAKNNYKLAFKKIHKAKIAITAAFICGFDTDTTEDINQRAQFIRESSLDTFTFTVLTPLPETPLFKELQKDDRIIYKNFPKDWLYYNFCHLTFKAKNANNEDIEAVYYQHAIKLHTTCVFSKKLLRSFLNTRSIRTTVAAYVFNKHHHIFLKESKLLRLMETLYNVFTNYKQK